jgi:hypothetical protein
MATGSLAIKYAVRRVCIIIAFLELRLYADYTSSGCDVITTCSTHHFAFVKSLGASEAFNYKDPDCSKKVSEPCRSWRCIRSMNA